MLASKSHWWKQRHRQFRTVPCCIQRRRRRSASQHCRVWRELFQKVFHAPAPAATREPEAA
jgi:hypothetical protein